jgi:hypothetical protein
MNCAVCGSRMSPTRCGRNSRLICPRGHTQSEREAVDAMTGVTAEPLRTQPAEHLSDWAWAEWVQEQGIGE